MIIPFNTYWELSLNFLLVTCLLKVCALRKTWTLKKKILAYSCFTILCCFLLYSKVKCVCMCVYIYIYPLILNFLPIKGTTEHWAEGFLHYTFQFSLVIYIIHSSVNLSIPISQLIPAPSLPSFCPWVCPLYLCLCSCFANRFIYTIF